MVGDSMRTANAKMAELEHARVEARMTLQEAEKVKARVLDDAGKMVCRIREEAEGVVRQAVEERRIAYEAEFKDAGGSEARCRGGFGESPASDVGEGTGEEFVRAREGARRDGFARGTREVVA